MELIEELVDHWDRKLVLRSVAYQTSMTGTDNDDVLDRMMPYSSMVTHYVSNLTFCRCGLR
jgi:hypothetical protein